jgi:hypothetical protein
VSTAEQSLNLMGAEDDDEGEFESAINLSDLEEPDNDNTVIGNEIGNSNTYAYVL